MTYIKIDDNTWIEYVEDKANIIKKDVLVKQVVELETIINNLPEINDDFLLEWAKEHYPEIQEVIIRENSVKELEKINLILTNLN